MSESAAAELLLEALDLVAQPGDAAGDGEFVDKEDGPDGHPGSEEKLEVFHRVSFREPGVTAEFESVVRASMVRRSSSRS